MLQLSSYTLHHRTVIVIPCLLSRDTDDSFGKVVTLCSQYCATKKRFSRSHQRRELLQFEFSKIFLSVDIAPLTPFAALAKDGERERKAEYSWPGTCNVILCPVDAPFSLSYATGHPNISIILPHFEDVPKSDGKSRALPIGIDAADSESRLDDSNCK